MNITYLAFLLIAYILCAPRVSQSFYSRLLFRPEKERGDKEAFQKQFGHCLAVHSISFNGCLLKAVYLENQNSQKLALINLGRDGDIERRARLIQDLLDLGLNVFVYEYPGYGESTGKPTINSVNHSGIAALDYVFDELKYEPNQVVIYGESMGVATSLFQIKHRTVAGAILKSGFFTLERVMKELYGVFRIYPTWLYPPLMNNAKLLQDSDCPLLIIHGQKDRMVNIEHARALNGLSDRSKLVILPDSRHAFMPDSDRVSYLSAITKFLVSLN